MAGSHLPKGAWIGYAHAAINLAIYEILLGDPRAIQWVPQTGLLSVAGLGAPPVSAGQEEDGTPLYAALAEYQGHKLIGKCSESLEKAFVVSDGKEREVKVRFFLSFFLPMVPSCPCDPRTDMDVCDHL